MRKTDDEHPKDAKNLFYYKAVEWLSKGKTVEYQEKARPIRLRTALLRGADFGKFESGLRVIKPKDDPRQSVLRKSGSLVYYTWKQREFGEQPSIENESDFTNFSFSASV